MADPLLRKYRLEIAVRKIYDLKHVSSSARIVFSVQLPHFPVIFIQPQIRGNESIVEFSPEGDRVLSVSYNVCHKAEFSISNSDCRRMFPTQCSCRLYDEALSPPTAEDSALLWLCPCPFVEHHNAQPFRGAHFEMRATDGRVMGTAIMSCRIVPVDCVAVAPAASSAAFTVSAPTMLTGSSGLIAIDGRPYIIRVIIDRRLFSHKDRKEMSNRVGRRSSIGKQPERCSNSLTVVGPAAVSAPPSYEEGEVLHRETFQAVVGDDLNVSKTSQKGEDSAVSEERNTFLYFLQYNVAYQISSVCRLLHSTLKREFAALNAVVIDNMMSHTTDTIDNHTQDVLKLANIMFQVANKLVTSGGINSADMTASEEACHNPVNKLPTPSSGSAVHFLVNRVLYQLQCVGANLCHMTSTYPKLLRVPLSTMDPEHVKFLTDLASHINELTKLVNIFVQSTIDGSFGTKVLFQGTTSSVSRRSSKSLPSCTPRRDEKEGRINGSRTPHEKDDAGSTGREENDGRTRIERQHVADKKAQSKKSSSTGYSTSTSSSTSTFSSSSTLSNSRTTTSSSSESYTDSFASSESADSGGSTIESLPLTPLSKVPPTVVYTAFTEEINPQASSQNGRVNVEAKGESSVVPPVVPLATPCPLPSSSGGGVPQPLVAVGNPISVAATTAANTYSSSTTSASAASQLYSQSGTSVPAAVPVSPGLQVGVASHIVDGSMLGNPVPPTLVPTAPAAPPPVSAPPLTIPQVPVCGAPNLPPSLSVPPSDYPNVNASALSISNAESLALPLPVPVFPASSSLTSQDTVPVSKTSNDVL
uniref:Uncharacterized protein TCIL3000_9_4900 n=1 Tax=Trypanosoma congolense (strain IL3000) TaxID=1068625 RepID=G0UUM2_TRYCI|nr:unnamed protein product [Trypanosoma congolense IL3000]